MALFPAHPLCAPPQATYRLAIQALGPRRFLYGACEGRSYVYTTLVTLVSLMWINLFFKAPGQANVPSLGLFFGLFAFQNESQLARVSLSSLDSDLQDVVRCQECMTHEANRLQRLYWTLAGALCIAPLMYAALLPNYQFPRSWV